MLPELLPGHNYLASVFRKPKIGRFIVFQNPQNRGQIMVKKIVSKDEGGFYVSGTVSWGTSSREIGLIPSELILGVVLRA